MLTPMEYENLIGRSLAKVQRKAADMILLIALVWTIKLQYHNLIDLLIDYLRIIPLLENFLSDTVEHALPEVIPQLTTQHILNKH